MEKIILLGGGGHCRSCIDVIEQEGTYQVDGIVDIPEKLGSELMGYKFIATDEDIPNLVKEYRYFHISLGMIRISNARQELFDKIKKAGGIFPVIKSPNTYVSKHATVGEGTIILHGVIINAGALVGMNCIINSHALVEHDARVGDHCHVATAAVINGGVTVGPNSFIGSGAITKQGIEILPGSFITANSIVS